MLSPLWFPIVYLIILLFRCLIDILACVCFSVSMLQNRFYRVKIDCGKFFSCLVVILQNRLLLLKLILGEVKIFYFLSESLLEELLNIDYFISKSILTKSILSRINSTKAELNMHLIIQYSNILRLFLLYMEFW